MRRWVAEGGALVTVGHSAGAAAAVEALLGRRPHGKAVLHVAWPGPVAGRGGPVVRSVVAERGGPSQEART
ncbi:hypothetical protein ABTY53_10560 [Streptomyces noursei]|uniref:hypothetical protein n=1 Tax=Streptomyces noursei TaxID=1971 RepID=UPI0033315B83